jgi:hypothetical protein
VASSGRFSVGQLRAAGSAPDDNIREAPSFRDGPKDQTSDVQLHIVNLEIPDSTWSLSSGRALRGPGGIAPE